MAKGLLLLIDDIATLLDDIAILTKASAKRTAGVVGDDLAVSANQVSGVRASRELPVVWAVFKGSLVNKAIMVPAALLLEALAPWAITPVLICGGSFLCFEGFEKIVHLSHRSADDAAVRQAELAAVMAGAEVDLVELEKQKIKGAIRTDLILSAEIIVISLGVVADQPFAIQAAVLSSMALIISVVVYGLVAGIVRLDDTGLYLSGIQGENGFARLSRWFGRTILRGTPYFMRLLSIGGTLAMFLVGGGILSHSIPAIHHAVEHLAGQVAGLPGVGGVLSAITPMTMNLVIGIVLGAVVTACVMLVKRVRAVA
ncbi:MAG: DUF808 domain-containing protein [Alphaproteobacteria bacterium]|nr:DUF808 domain-containing protein [Alphaproteobacteria bacterium]